FAALPNGAVVQLPATPTARVQIIHNSPEPTVDLYVDNAQLADNFEFRTATPFIDVPSDRALTVGVAGANSASAADAIATFPVNFETGKSYVVMAGGVVGATGATAFNLFVNGNAREAGTGNNVDVAVFHGSPDAPAVDVDAVFVADNVVSNLSFGQFTGYLSLPAAKYDLAIQPAGTTTTVASYRADLSGLAGGAATVFASGYLTQAPGFGLYAALPNGAVIALPATPTARVQIIHNSPAPTVDVYADGARLIDNFEFRKATPFITVPADRAITIGIAGENSNSAADAIATFPANFNTGGTYVVMAAGVVGATGATAFDLFVKEGAREISSGPANVDVQLFHGAPDAPEVDVRLPGGAILFDNVEFGEYADYQSIPATNYKVYLTPSNDNSNILAAYTAPLSLIPGQAVTVFASGYFAGGTPAFGVWAALSSGVTLPLTPAAVSVNELENVTDFRLAPNPAVDQVVVSFDVKESSNLRYRIMDYSGRLVQEGDFGQVSAGAFSERILVNDLPQGTYNLEVRSEAGSKVTRFVIQK
ncbi:MAG: DUF4397 domain-containing protein, partial [Bacteroidota bacterium]